MPKELLSLVRRIRQTGACRDLVLLDIFMNYFGTENTIPEVADTTDLEGIARILEDKTINKITLTNCVSSLKYRIKFNGDKHKGLQLSRNKTSKCMNSDNRRGFRGFLVNQERYESAMSYREETKHHTGIYKQESRM